MKRLIALVLAGLMVLGGACLAAEWPQGRSAAQPYSQLPEVNLSETIGYIMLFPRAKLPASRYCGVLAKTARAVEECGLPADVEKEMLVRLNGLVKEAQNAKCALAEKLEGAERLPEGRAQAVFYRDEVVPAMNALRTPVDAAEPLVDRALWPVPTYADLLFEV